ncbi:hypothetical protein CDEF62S_02361 [Castellaniella defragrans]
MKMYILSLAVGLLAGVLYSVLNVRSPAPPLVALIGLLGMLIGEQAIPVGKQLLCGTGFVAACDKTRAIDSVFGQLPGRQVTLARARAAKEDPS